MRTALIRVVRMLEGGVFATLVEPLDNSDALETEQWVQDVRAEECGG